MHRALLCCGLLFVGSALAASGWDVPPPPTGRFVVDQTGTLRADTVTQLEELARSLDASGAGQLGVLVLRTTGGEAPRRFATDVFNAWGIGHAGRDDGVLLFLALDDRKAEVVVGTREPLAKQQTDAIMANDIVANMKRKDPDGALLAAARSVLRELGAQAPASEPTEPDQPASALPPRLDPEAERLARYVRREVAFPDLTPRRWVIDLSDSTSASDRAELELISNELYAEGKGRLVFLLLDVNASWPSVNELVDVLAQQLGPTSKLPLAVVAHNASTWEAHLRLPTDRVSGEWEAEQLALASSRLHHRCAQARLVEAGQFAAGALRTGIPPRPMGDVLRAAVSEHATALWSGLLSALAGAAWWVRRWLRVRPRDCETCLQPRERLTEADDDAHLSDGQRSEEQLRSVDYDVWFCGRCNDALVLRYGAWFSRYGDCSSCGFKTMSSSSTTLRAATQYSTGLVRVTETCKHCGKVSTYERVTARLPKPSSSSSSSWSSGSSRSSGSFGGGRSSGSW